MLLHVHIELHKIYSISLYIFKEIILVFIVFEILVTIVYEILFSIVGNVLPIILTIVCSSLLLWKEVFMGFYNGNAFVSFNYVTVGILHCAFIFLLC